MLSEENRNETDSVIDVFFAYKLVAASLLSCIMPLYYYAVFFLTLCFCVFPLQGESDIKKGQNEIKKREREEIT